MKKTFNKVTFLLTSALLLTFVSCKKSILEPTSPKMVGRLTSMSASVLPNRKTQVYIGIADYWAQQADPANYSQWNYVRHNADGFYANFISMWQNKYQSSAPQQNINNMRSAFVNNGCFLETSLETQVNDSPNGANNQSTDENSIAALSTGGFNVNNTSLNYGVNTGRVNTLKTYQYSRTCMALEGAWTFGGDINGAGNAQVRQDILATDGVELDGPMGFWYSNGGGMREGTYSAIQFAHSHGLLATILLSPYNAGQSGYNATNDFFNTSKQCVLNCEDNNAAPDIWAIWTYGEDPAQPAFPESVTTNGQVAPANTMMGVGYWLLKHLNNLPQFQIPNTGAVGNNTSVNIIDNSHAQLTMNTLGDTTSFYAMPIVFSNSPDPQIEISPVISAALSGDTTNWKVTFKLGSQDVTNQILHNGGLNCVGTKRITNNSNLNLVMNLKASNQAAQPISVNFTTMSNIGNTGNISNYSIVAQTQSGLVNAGIYQITNRYVNKVLEFAGAGTANGTLADLFDWNGTLTQHIRLNNQGNGYFRLTPMHDTGACLDNSGSLANGAQATLWEWNGGTNQMWSVSAVGNGFYKIINQTSGKALEDTGSATNNGAAACQWDYVGGANQQWKFTYLGN